jgi:hypothetical protein
MASVWKPSACEADGFRKGEKWSDRKALAKAGQSIFHSGRPITPDDNSDPKLDKALQKFFVAQTSQNRLDIERFIIAQAALARALGDVSDRLAATTAFLAFRGERDPLKNFVCWQRGILQDRDMSTAEIVEVVGHATEDVKRGFDKDLHFDWQRNRRPYAQTRTNQWGNHSHAQNLKQLATEDRPMSMPAPDLASSGMGDSCVAQASPNSVIGKREVDSVRNSKMHPTGESKEISRKRCAVVGGNRENSSTRLRQPAQQLVKHSKHEAESLPKQMEEKNRELLYKKFQKAR